MHRIALILPTSTYRAKDFLDAARAIDAAVVVASERGQALADAMGDRFVRIDLTRPQWSADRIVERGPFDAVVPVDDQGVMIAALAAEKLQLPHNPPPAVALTGNKSEMRRALAEAGVTQPDFTLVDSDDDAGAVVAALGPPCVLKPLSLSASQGVIRVDDPSRAPETAERIRAIVAGAGGPPEAPLLAERYLPGAEVAVEGMVAEGRLLALAVLDKPEPLEGPYFEETMFVAPSRLGWQMRGEVVGAAQAAVTALGLYEGPIHAELRVVDGTPYVLEVAARPIGGLCSRALRFGLLGASLESVLLRHALRLPQAGLDPLAAATGVMMLPIPERGVLERVDGRNRALAVPGVLDLQITIPPGEPVIPLPEGNRYLGFLFARGANPVSVEESLRAGLAALDVRIAPPPGTADGGVSSLPS